MDNKFPSRYDDGDQWMLQPNHDASAAYRPIPLFNPDGSPTALTSSVLIGEYGQRMGYTPARDEGFLKEFGKGMVRGGAEFLQGTARTLGGTDTADSLEFFLATNRQLADSESKGVWSYIGNVAGAQIAQNAPMLAATLASGGIAGIGGKAAMAAARTAASGMAAKEGALLVGKAAAGVAAKKLFAAKAAGFVSTFVMEHGGDLRELRERLPDVPDGQRVVMALALSLCKSYIEVGLGATAATAKAVATRGLGKELLKGGTLDGLSKMIMPRWMGAVGNSVIGKWLKTATDETFEEMLQHSATEALIAVNRGASYDKGVAELFREYATVMREGFIGGMALGVLPTTMNALTEADIRIKKNRLTSRNDAARENLDAGQPIDGVRRYDQAKVSKTNQVFADLFSAIGRTFEQDPARRTRPEDNLIHLCYNIADIASRQEADPKKRDTIRPENYIQDLSVLLMSNTDDGRAAAAVLNDALDRASDPKIKNGPDIIIEALNKIHSETGIGIVSVMETAQFRRLEAEQDPIRREVMREVMGDENAEPDGLRKVADEAGASIRSKYGTQRELRVAGTKVIEESRMSEMLASLGDKARAVYAFGWITGIKIGESTKAIKITRNRATGGFYGEIYDQAQADEIIQNQFASQVSRGKISTKTGEALAQAKARGIELSTLRSRWDDFAKSSEAYKTEPVSEGVKPVPAAPAETPAAETPAPKPIVDAKQAQVDAELEAQDAADAQVSRAKALINFAQAIKQELAELPIEDVIERKRVNDFVERYKDVQIPKAEDAKTDEERTATEQARGTLAEQVAEVEAILRKNIEAIRLEKDAAKYFNQFLPKSMRVRVRYEKAESSEAVETKTVEEPVTGARRGSYFGGYDRETGAPKNSYLEQYNSLMALFPSHDAATVLHELIHHMVENALMPESIRKVFWEQYAKSALGTKDPAAQDYDLMALPDGAQENIANTLLAFIMENKISGATPAMTKAYTTLRAIIQASVKSGMRNLSFTVDDAGGMSQLDGTPLLPKDEKNKAKTEKMEAMLKALIMSPVTPDKLAQIYGDALEKSVTLGMESGMYDSVVTSERMALLGQQLGMTSENLQKTLATKYGEKVKDPVVLMNIVDAELRDAMPGADVKKVSVRYERGNSSVGMQDEAIYEIVGKDEFEEARRRADMRRPKEVAEASNRLIGKLRTYISTALDARGMEDSDAELSKALRTQGKQLRRLADAELKDADAKREAGSLLGIDIDNFLDALDSGVASRAISSLVGVKQNPAPLKPLDLLSYKTKTSDADVSRQYGITYSGQQQKVDVRYEARRANRKRGGVLPSVAQGKSAAELGEWAKTAKIVSAAVVGSNGKIYPDVKAKGFKPMGHVQAVMAAAADGAEPMVDGVVTSDGQFASRTIAGAITGHLVGEGWDYSMVARKPDVEIGGEAWQKYLDDAYSRESVGGTPVPVHARNERSALGRVDTKHAELWRRFKAGDAQAEAEAKKVVQEAAKKAGYTIGKVYHGTQAPNFNEFSQDYAKSDSRFHFAVDRATAEGYAGVNGFSDSEAAKISESMFGTKRFWDLTGEQRRQVIDAVRAQSRVIEAYLRIDDLDNYKNGRHTNPSGIKGGEFRGALKETGHYAVLLAEQIKSADPFTYDDKGNLIPLSKRFDSGKVDIRYERVSRPPPDFSRMTRKDLTNRVRQLFSDKAGRVDNDAIRELVTSLYGDRSTDKHPTGVSQLSDSEVMALIMAREDEVSQEETAPDLPPFTEDLAASVNEGAVRNIQDLAGRSMFGKAAVMAAKGWRGLISNIADPYTFCNLMAGGNPDSPWIKLRDAIYAVNDVSNASHDKVGQAMVQEIANATGGIDLDELVWREIEVVDESGNRRLVTSSDAVEVWVLAEGGTDVESMEIQKLLLSNPSNSKNGFDKKMVRELVDIVNKDKNLRAIAAITQKHANEAFESAAEVYYKVTGKVAKPVSGLYSPGEYEGQSYDEGDPALPFLDNANRGSTLDPTERKEFKHKRRSPGSERNTDYISKIFKHIDALTMYAAKAEAINEMLAAVESDVMRQAFLDKFGDAMMRDKFVQMLLREMAPSGNMRRYAPAERGVNDVSRNLVSAMLGFNPFSTLTQLVTAGPVISVLGVKSAPNLIVNLFRVVSRVPWGGSEIGGTELAAKIRRLSPSVLIESKRTPGHELLHQLLDKSGAGALRMHNKVLYKVRQTGMKMMAGMDLFLRMASWETAFNQKYEELSLLTGQYSEAQRERMAAAFAEDVILKSHNPTTFSEKGLWQTESAAMFRSLLAFQSQPFANMKSFLVDGVLPVLQAYQKDGLPGMMKKLTSDTTLYRKIMFGAFLPGLALGLIGRRRRQKNLEEVLSDAIWLGLGSLVPVLGGLLWWKSVTGFSGSSSFNSLFTQYIDSIANTVGGLTGQRPVMKTIPDAIRVVEGLTGIPDYPLKITRKMFEGIFIDGGKYNGLSLWEMLQDASGVKPQD